MTSDQEERLNAILENAVDAIIIINENGIIELTNPATSHMFGFLQDELLGSNVSILMPEPIHSEHDGYLHNYRATGKKKIIGVGREVQGRKSDGTIFPVHVAVSEFYSSGRRLFTGVVRDVSDLKAVQLELKNANEYLEQRVREKTQELKEAQAGLLENARLATLGQVSGGIAHEIRNPLNAVKTSVYYLLHARNLTEEKTREHLERIDRQVTVMDNVLTALTDVALMPEPSLQEIDIRGQVQEVLHQIGLPPNIQIINELPEDRQVVVRADMHQFPIVLRNLLRNARDAMPDGGSIRIALRQLESQIALDVCDQGEGISPEHLPLITEPFFSTKSRGMGLGLAISKAILEKNGGRLEVNSKPGSGSTFSMVFPVGEPKERA